MGHSPILESPKTGTAKEPTMMYHPALLSQIAHEHIDALVEEASRHRLASALRRGRRQLWPDSNRSIGVRETAATAGRLAPCEVLPRAAAQVR
jgi:hypothetical protein